MSQSHQWRVQPLLVSRAQVPRLPNLRASSEKKIANLQRENEALKQSKRQLEEQNANLTTLNTTAVEETRLIRTDIEELRTQYRQLLNAFQSARLEKTALQAEIRCLNDENAFLRRQTEEFNVGRIPPPTPPKRGLHGGYNKRHPTVCMCGLRFPTKDEMEKHLREKVRGLFVCDSEGCQDQRFSSEKDARNHKKLVHYGHKQWLCTGCKGWFDTQSTLKTHRSIHKCRNKRIVMGCGAESVREEDEINYELNLEN